MTTIEAPPTKPESANEHRVLTAEGVGFDYGGRTARDSSASVLRDLDFGLEPGELAVITGPSGSGKTTLFSLLATLKRATVGEIRLWGTPISTLSGRQLAEQRRKLGIVCQNHYLLPQYSVLENLVYALMPHDRSTQKRHQIAEQWLERLALGDRLHQKARSLSGGEAQRVAVARALVTEPRCILADEPTSQLDDELGRLVTELFKQQAEDGGAVVVFTHDPRLVDAATSRYRLEKGALTRET